MHTTIRISKQGGIFSRFLPGPSIYTFTHLSSFYRIFSAAEVPIDWEPVDVTPVRYPDGTMGIPKEVIDSVNRNKVGLKSPLMTPVGKGFRSLNLALRKTFNLYANVRPCRSIEGKG